MAIYEWTATHIGDPGRPVPALLGSSPEDFPGTAQEFAQHKLRALTDALFTWQGQQLDDLNAQHLAGAPDRAVSGLVVEVWEEQHGQRVKVAQARYP
jgi:hypothetical protein